MNLIKSNTTGVILAGGQSRRMGFNKAEAEMHGESMLIRMVDKLKRVVPHIILSTGTTTYPNINFSQVADEYPGCGPLGGIYSALKFSTTSFNLVVSCDIPMVSISLLKYILVQAIGGNALITVPVDHDGQVQTMCAVYHRDILPFVEQQMKDQVFKMKELVNLVPVEFVKISREHPLYQEHAFMNVNTPSSLQQARKIWNSQQE